MQSAYMAVYVPGMLFDTYVLCVPAVAAQTCHDAVCLIVSFVRAC